MGGALDRLAVEKHRLVHQDVTGVGYGICTYEVTGRDDTRNFLDIFIRKQRQDMEKRKAAEDAWVSLARSSVESYVRTGEKISLPEDLPAELTGERAGAFVSLHLDGALRGCIGTIGPVTECVACEIIDNAVSAATADPRFNPVREDELDRLEYSVDVLGAAEDIDSPDMLDVKRYGVIVSSGYRRGLLLPDLEGVDTVEEQIAIARRKAGIDPGEKIKLQRFEVIRHK
jgi:AmmeMemoRadiSam system protein A